MVGTWPYARAMSRARSRALQVAGGVAVAGGLLLGGAPMPLADYGCAAAFAGAGEVTGNTTDVVVACAEQRAQRQEVAFGFLVLGVATALGAEVHRRTGRAADATPAPARQPGVRPQAAPGGAAPPRPAGSAVR